MLLPGSFGKKLILVQLFCKLLQPRKICKKRSKKPHFWEGGDLPKKSAPKPVVCHSI